jgi:hypothetical protein
MKKFLKWSLFVVVCLATLWGLFVAVENWRGKHAWDVYQRGREAKGDSFDWKSITPAPVPDPENFAMIPLFAELFPKQPQNPKLNALRLPDCKDSAGDWHLSRTENLAAWKKCFTNDDLLAVLKVYEPMLGEIGEALQQRPKCRFPVRYEDHFNALLPHLMHVRNIARVYRLRALAELSAGRTDAALEDVRLCLRLADTIKDEPILISYLVRVAMVELAAQPVWEGLASHRWNDRQLAALQAEFANINQVAAYAHAMRGERLFAYSACRWLINKRFERLSALEFAGVQGSGWQHALNRLIVALIPAGWWYQNMLKVDRLHAEVYWPAIDVKYHRLDPSRWAQLEEEFKSPPHTPYNVLTKLLMPSLGSCAKTTASSQTTMDELVAACALERYRLAKGALPEKLDVLVPEFLAKVPTDVITGEPLRYQRDGDHFKLWSVGWNQTDEGGVVATTGEKKQSWNKDKGDWVWEYPLGSR